MRIALCFLLLIASIVIIKVSGSLGDSNKQIGELRSQFEKQQAESNAQLAAVNENLVQAQKKFSDESGVRQQAEKQLSSAALILKRVQDENDELKRQLATPIAATKEPEVEAGPMAVPLHPTADDAKKLFQLGQYPDCLRALAGVLAVSGGYDKQEMLILRAECLIQTKQFSTAVELLNGVAKTCATSGDSTNAANAGALSFLVKQSLNGMYTPKTGSDKKPLSILDLGIRKQVLQATFEDEYAFCDKRSRDAQMGTSILPIIEIGKEFQNLQYLERVATGGVVRSTPMGRPLALLAAKTMEKSLRDMEEQVSKISSDASQEVVVNDGITTHVGGKRSYSYQYSHDARVGLNHQSSAALRDIQTTCNKVLDTTKDFVQEFGVNSDVFGYVNLRAAEIGNDAKAALTRG